MTADDCLAQMQAARAAELSRALDIALVEYGRRYGGVRFEVSAMRVTKRGVEFTVTPSGQGAT